jgi:hypothetical protein
MFNAEYIFGAIEFTADYSYVDVSAKFSYGNVLIYVPILGLYQLFNDISSYQTYLDRMKLNNMNNLLFRQLVLISAEHKFILRCENKIELIEKIKNILNTNIVDIKESPTYVQLTFDGLRVSSFAEEQVLFEKIMRQVLDVSVYIPRHNGDNKFVENDMNCTNKSVMKMLKNIENYVMQAKTIVNVNPSGVIQGNVSITVVNKSNPTNDNKEKLINWLQANQIDDKILQSEYRQKFFNDTGINIHSNTFGKCASKYVDSFSSNGKGYYKSKN